MPFYVCRSICLTVVPKGKTKMSKYRYEIKQLPGDILTDEKKTYFKVINTELISVWRCICEHVLKVIHCVPKNVHLFIFQITLSKINWF